MAEGDRIASRCPRCGAAVEHPRGAPGHPGHATHSTRDCPSCSTPLIFFGDADFTEGWRVDTRELRRQDPGRGGA